MTDSKRCDALRIISLFVVALSIHPLTLFAQIDRKRVAMGRLASTLVLTIGARMAALFILTGTIVACGSLETAKPPNTSELTSAALSQAQGEVRFYGPAIWYSGNDGIRQHSFPYLPSIPSPYFLGVIVVSDQSIDFTMWVPEARSVGTKHVLLTDLGSIALDSFGFNRRLVLYGQDGSCNSFEFNNKSYSLVDVDKLEHTFAFLRNIVKDGKGKCGRAHS